MFVSPIKYAEDSIYCSGVVCLLCDVVFNQVEGRGSIREICTHTHHRSIDRVHHIRCLLLILLKKKRFSTCLPTFRNTSTHSSSCNSRPIPLQSFSTLIHRFSRSVFRCNTSPRAVGNVFSARALNDESRGLRKSRLARNGCIRAESRSRAV